MVWFVLVYHDLFFANYSICFSVTSEIVTKKSPLRGPGLSIWNNGTGGSKAAYTNVFILSTKNSRQKPTISKKLHRGTVSLDAHHTLPSTRFNMPKWLQRMLFATYGAC